jgi:hypothetical protein
VLTRSSSILIALCFSRSGTDTGFAGSNSRFSRAIWISSTVIVRCRGIEGGLESTKADAAALQLVYEADQLARRARPERSEGDAHRLMKTMIINF